MEQVIKVLGEEGAKLAVWLIVGIAILIGLALVVWLLMKIFGRSLNMAGGGRGQPQRLGITGAFNIDRKGRKLVIVRRDNVEHLVMIGGPNDILVESNIIRAQSLPRPMGQQPAMMDPVDPQALSMSAQTVMPAPVAAAPPPAPPVTVAQPPASPVTAAPPVQQPRAPQPEPVRVTEPPRPARPPWVETPPPAPIAVEPPTPPVAPAAPAPVTPAAAATEAPQTPAAATARSTDPRLSDMAKRLQSVLQRPITPAPRAPRTVDADAAAAAETKPIPLPSQQRKPEVAPSDPVAAPAAPPAPPKAPRVDEPVTQGKPLSAPPLSADSGDIDSLEEEMARLLGRTGPGKM